MKTNLIQCLIGLMAFVVASSTSTAIDIVTTNVSVGMERMPYSATLHATNGTSPFKWSAMPFLVGWGQDSQGQATMPSGLSNVVAIAAGYYHSMALKSDGRVVAWGWNYYGQTTVPTKLSNVVAIAAGYYHSMALKSDGRVVAWGAGVQTNVPPELSNVVAIAAGRYDSVALRSNGNVVAWGRNDFGQSDVPLGPLAFF